MRFEVYGIKKSLNDIMRTVGYKPAYFQDDGEFSIVRQLGKNDYPRFHIYIKELNNSPEEISEKVLVFNLHLDQKKVSYTGSHAHSGEYDGELVEKEAKRIKQFLR